MMFPKHSCNNTTKSTKVCYYKGTKGRGTRHVVYWKHTNESGVQPLKVNLIVYENDVLQVKVSTIL